MGKISIEENKLFRYTLMITGIILCAVGINGFLTPANMLSGGVAGICVIMNTIWGVNQGVVSFLINIPIFLVALKFLKKDFLWISFINMFIFSLALGATQDLYKYIVINDTMLQCIYGALLNGAGMGLIFKSRASAGGLDVVAAMLKEKLNIDMKHTFMLVNFFVVGIGGFLFGAKLAMYTLIAIYITSIIMDITKDSFNNQKSILLVSEKNEEIAEKIMTKIGRGVTFLDAEGAYTHNRKKIIYCILQSGEVGRLKDLVYNIDEHAFISINDVDEVRGGGFKARFL